VKTEIRAGTVLEIDDIHTLEILNSPVRLKILRHLDEPRSVKELAHRMGVPLTRLYYHVNILAESGVIECVETRKVGAALERRYLARANILRPSHRLLEGGHDPDDLARIAAAVVLDGTRVDAEAALRLHFREMAEHGPGVSNANLARTLVHLDEEGARVVEEKVAELIATLNQLDQGNGGKEYALTLVFVPVVDEVA
jgi:DNA-binding transcriptional ArsR family regulator